MDEVKKVKGVLWDDGVIANARWAGVRVRDILEVAGIDLSSLSGWHVCFTSNVTPCQDDRDYGASVPLTTVMDPDGDVLLAYDVSARIYSINWHPLSHPTRLDERSASLAGPRVSPACGRTRIPWSALGEVGGHHLRLPRRVPQLLPTTRLQGPPSRSTPPLPPPIAFPRHLCSYMRLF